jgi:hypothetical protein
MKVWINLGAVIKEPDALRGLDHLVDRARRVLDRYMRIPVPMPVRNPDPKPLARTA